MEFTSNDLLYHFQCTGAECAVGQHGDHLRQRDGADCVVFPVDKSSLGEDFELMRREKRKTSVMEHN